MKDYSVMNDFHVLNLILLAFIQFYALCSEFNEILGHPHVQIMLAVDEPSSFNRDLLFIKSLYGKLEISQFADIGIE